jgi:hypothetical protein
MDSALLGRMDSSLRGEWIPHCETNGFTIVGRIDPSLSGDLIHHCEENWFINLRVRRVDSSYLVELIHHMDGNINHIGHDKNSKGKVLTRKECKEMRRSSRSEGD